MTGAKMNHVGATIRKLRKQRGWTQEELAHLAQVDTSYLGQIERMQRSPTIGILVKIADALGVDCSALLTEVRRVHASRLGEDDSDEVLKRIADELTGKSRDEQLLYYKLFKLLQEIVASAANRKSQEN